MPTQVKPVLSPLPGNPTQSQVFTYLRTYSRWREDLGRREVWQEGVDRYFDFFRKRLGDRVPAKVWERCHAAMSAMDVVGSMRAFWTAGPALERDNACGYNCIALAVKDLRAFVELFHLLMCGCGVTFCVEKEFIDQLPPVAVFTGLTAGTHVVGDSREGWGLALKTGLEAWFAGQDLDYDFSQVRPKGSRLKTMGGRASGPDPLRNALTAIRAVVLGAQGRRLLDVEVLDIGNLTAEAVEVGGIRRSAEATTSDLDSQALRDAKTPPYPVHRRQSNNSAVYFKRPDMVAFMREWTALAASGTGERGIFNVGAAGRASPRREASRFLRPNPCFEILLDVQDVGQACNLSEVVVRPGDSFADLQEKVRSAVWLGAMQATLTDFPALRPGFKRVCERDRLLGVSLTGQMDVPGLMTRGRLDDLRDTAVREARKASKALGINMPVAITTTKPSGTVSQLMNCSSGAHPRYARYYLRRYRIGATDPLFRLLRDQGVEMVPEVGQAQKDVDKKRQALRDAGKSAKEAAVLVPDWTPDSVMTWVVAFPEAAPAGALTRHDVSAMDQLKWYLKLRRHWSEHNVSLTVYVKENEWLKVGAWVWEHFDEVIGLSFLPFDGGSYELSPYQELTKDQYDRAVKAFPVIDYSKLSQYEAEDNTTGAKAAACSGTSCELT